MQRNNPPQPASKNNTLSIYQVLKETSHATVAALENTVTNILFFTYILVAGAEDRAEPMPNPQPVPEPEVPAPPSTDYFSAIFPGVAVFLLLCGLALKNSGRRNRNNCGEENHQPRPHLKQAETKRQEVKIDSDNQNTQQPKPPETKIQEVKIDSDNQNTQPQSSSISFSL